MLALEQEKQAKSDPLSPPLSNPTRLESDETAEGAMIGPYRLLERIGQGGMGEVWLAEQTLPVRRRVAIKLIKAGMDTREVVARFASERQALALMDHPAIAKVFDAGSTPRGRLYFVMEYVDGISITGYCDRHRLTIRQRLELFVRVCEGVQHAHQKAIIHRDLKPSNILVGEMDNGQPMPRIIDFGVAKAITRGFADDTITTFTRSGSVVGTPAYMSPEQADSAGHDVDTRADVYSLGVVLFELLVGALPLDADKLPVCQMPGRRLEQDTPSPSVRLRSLGDETNSAAQNRRTDASALARQLRGDLDAITLKALERDRSRRYATPSELAADISRYLRGEAVIARPASAAYRSLKYVRRHRASAAVAAAISLLLISFVAAQSIQLQRTTRERDRANRERDRANRVTDFMKQMFKVSDPSEARGASVTAREILDKASKDIGTGLAGDPQLQAQMMDVMGNVYESLGLYSRSLDLLQRSAAISSRIIGPDHPDTLRTRAELGWTLQQEGHYSEAEKIQRYTLAAQRRVLGPDSVDTLKTMKNLAWTLQQEGRGAEAEQLDRQAAEARRRLLGPDNPQTLGALAELATALQDEGRYPEAEKLQRETLAAQRRVLGIEHPDALATANNLASTLELEGKYSEAEKIYRELVDITRRVLGPEHPDSLTIIANLSECLFQQGRYRDAETMQRQILAIRRRVLGPDHPETLKIANDLALSLGEEGRYTEAEKLQRQTLDVQRRVLGPDHPSTAISAYNLAIFVAKTGRRGEAFRLLRDSVDHGLPPAVDRAIEKDTDLNSLHSDPRFPSFVAYANERAASAHR